LNYILKQNEGSRNKYIILFNNNWQVGNFFELPIFTAKKKAGGGRGAAVRVEQKKGGSKKKLL